MNPLRTLATLLLCGALAACGSGGGGGDGGAGGGGGGGGGGPVTYAIGGTVTGLSGTVVLQNNGGDDLTVAADGRFQFTTALAAGATYSVSVLTAPAGQSCAVARGAGTATALVTDVAVSCSNLRHQVGGVVSGLAGTLVVRNNGGDDLTLSENGAFAFAASVDHGGTYSVTVATQPAGLNCSVVDGAGTALAEVTDVAVACTTAGVLSLFAGDMQGRGNIDGTGALARFTLPSNVAGDSHGNLYVSDTLHHTIRKVTPAGVVTTFAGKAGHPGRVDGPLASARFHQPSALAVDGADNLFVADIFNNAIRKITPAGVVSTFAAPLSPGNYNGMAADAAGNVYVADALHAIRRITPAGVVSLWAGQPGTSGSTDGAAADARFYSPGGLAVDGAGNVYVADTYNSTIRKITPAGAVSTLAGTAGAFGGTDGTGAAARFVLPLGLAVDAAGNLYVADSGNTVRKVTPAGVVSTLAGQSGFAGSTNGTGAAARFWAPTGVAMGTGGSVVVADSFNGELRQVSAAGVVSTLAGSAGLPGSADGVGTAARFQGPNGVVADGAGNLFLADTTNHTLRKITAAGSVSTLAGLAGNNPGHVDGLGAAARFSYPAGLALDGAGNLYVSENTNVIRKVSPAGLVSTLAGSASLSGSADGVGGAARFYAPRGLAVDGAGNVYVADSLNATIRRVTPAGEVSTFAGTAGAPGSADGAGAAARFRSPSGLAFDGAGNLVVVDSGNHTIRRITPAGVVSTVAGSAGQSGSVDGTGPAARFQDPISVAPDGAGNLYVTDGNHTVRRIAPDGAVSTFLGSSYRASFEPGAMPGLLSFPSGLVVSGGSLFVTMGYGVARAQPVP